MAQFQASIAQCFKLLSNSIVTRALGLYAWFRPASPIASALASPPASNVPNASSENETVVAASTPQPATPVAPLTDEQVRELQGIVRTNLTQISDVQKRYSKRGYRIKIE